MKIKSKNIHKKIGAFFDFDKTLLDVESGKLGIRWLFDNRMVSIPFILKVLLANFFYQRHLVSDERMVKTLITYYKNKNLSFFEAGAQEFYEVFLKSHLAPNIVKKVHAHKKEGHILILISGSVRYLLKPVVEDLGFDYLLCTDLEMGSDGLLTGKPKGNVCVDKNKKSLAIDLSNKVGIDVSISYAYGNHQADIPLLESVGNPYVVEPTKPLEKVARKRSWPVLSFR